MKFLRSVIRGNRAAIMVGALAGLIGTRFMEDGNLLVSSVFILLATIIVLSIWLVAKKLAR